MKLYRLLVLVLLAVCMVLMIPASAMATSHRTLHKQVTAYKKQVKALKADNAKDHATINALRAHDAADNQTITFFLSETLVLERVVERAGYTLDEGTYHNYIYSNSPELWGYYATADEWIDGDIGTLPFSAGYTPSFADGSSSESSVSLSLPQSGLNLTGLKKSK
jgi:hypothetical protein